MPTTPDSDGLLRRLHDTYHAPPESDIHEAINGPVRTPSHDTGYRFLFRDNQPGTPSFVRAHLVGSAAPEPLIERMDGVGGEDVGPVEILDGRTGQSLARVSRHARRRLEAR